MEQLHIFEIFFYNGSGVFYSGNIIHGYVTVELKEPMKIREIKLKFEGKADTHFNIRRRNDPSGFDYNVGHSGTEKYFDQDVLLFGTCSGEGSDTGELQAGRHTFIFQFQLPQGLPSSYESKVGHVRYTVKSTINRPWTFDHHTKRVFTVISVLDLNTQPNSMSPLKETEQKYVCCCCCKSGPIEATFHIDRIGYVPGEAIKLYAEINNGASVSMEKSFVDLKMLTTYRVKSNRSKTITYEVARLTRPGIAGHSKDSWTGEPLVVPPLPPSYLVGCNIIDIRYILQLNVVPNGWGLDLEIPLEIIIGTVPLRSVVEQNPPMLPLGFIRGNTHALETIAPGEMFCPLPPPNDQPNLPPPSYIECITGRYNMREKGDDKHTRGNMEYAPVYTYYNWGHTPGPMPVQSLRAG